MFVNQPAEYRSALLTRSVVWIAYILGSFIFLPQVFVASGLTVIPLPFWPIGGIYSWVGVVLLIPISFPKR